MLWLLLVVLNTVLWGAIVKREGMITVLGVALLIEEILIGAGVGFAAGMILGVGIPLSIVVAIVCGLLWAFGGAEGVSKFVRKIGVGLAISLIGYVVSWNWLAFLVLPLMLFGTAQGYGIPDGTDEGSNIGRFWYKTVCENEFLANVFTRITVGILYSVALIPLMCV